MALLVDVWHKGGAIACSSAVKLKYINVIDTDAEKRKC
ncbi:MAG: hypothetical protein ACJAY2_002541 [Pseudomonadales bacterium]|jgi:hypothetical protein